MESVYESREDGSGISHVIAVGPYTAGVYAAKLLLDGISFKVVRLDERPDLIIFTILACKKHEKPISLRWETGKQICRTCEEEKNGR